MTRLFFYLLFVLTAALFSCKTARTTEETGNRISAVPEGEVTHGEQHEALDKLDTDPRAGYSFSLAIDGPATGRQNFDWTPSEGQVVKYSRTSNINEIAFHVEQPGARLYIGLNFEGNGPGVHHFREGGSLPAMKFSIASDRGNYEGRVSSGMLLVEHHNVDRGVIMGKFRDIRVEFNGQSHELSASFMLPLQVR